MDWMSDSSRNRHRNRKKKAERAKKGRKIKTNNKISAAKQVISNPLTFKKILGFLDNTGDLLNCRAVSSDWKSLATCILLQRQCLRIPLVYDKETKTYVKFTEQYRCYQDPKIPLKNLVGLIKSASAKEAEFPCVSFKITVGDLQTRDISSFFHLYGERIQILELEFLKYDEQWEKDAVECACGRDHFSTLTNYKYAKTVTVRRILCRQLPNLRLLIIWGVENDHKINPQEYFAFHNLFENFQFQFQVKAQTQDQDQAQSHLQVKSKSTKPSTALSPGKIMMIARIPQLEKLFVSIWDFHEFHDSYSETAADCAKSVVMENMFGSKSLEFFRDQDTCKDCVSALISLNQVEKLKYLSMLDLGLDLVEQIVDECLSQLNLNQVQINCDWKTIKQFINSHSMKRRMIRVLTAIFSSVASSSSTYSGISIELNQTIGFLCDSDSDLAPDFEIPVLKKVSSLRLKRFEEQDELAISNDQTDTLLVANTGTSFFPRGFILSHSFPNLHSVNLCSTEQVSTVFWGENSQSLPNLVEISIKDINNFPAVAPFLWKFKELEELRIGFWVGPSLNANKKGAIDAAITGFTMETCQMLRKSEEYLQWARLATEWKEQEQNEEERNKREKNPSEPPEWLTSLRVNPSICDLPKLKKLKLLRRGSYKHIRESSFEVFKLSSLLAFDLMPQLKVEFANKYG